MSGTKPPDAIDTQDLQEWVEALGLPLEPAEDDRALRNQLRDGIFLCQLVNRIKPGSVENVSESSTIRATPCPVISQPCL